MNDSQFRLIYTVLDDDRRTERAQRLIMTIAAGVALVAGSVLAATALVLGSVGATAIGVFLLMSGGVVARFALRRRREGPDQDR